MEREVGAYVADTPRYPESENNGMEPGRGPPRVPRWVKVSGILGGALIVLVAIRMLFAGGGLGAGGFDHGPGHTPPDDAPVDFDHE
jgi:hypothetical protein